MELFKRTAHGRHTQRQAGSVTILAVSNLDSAVTLQVGDFVMRLDRAEVSRIASSAGVVATAHETIAELRGLAASLAAR